MTERDITGDTRSAYRRAQAIATRSGLTGDDLRAIADGVREFDAQRTPEQRSAAALEKIASKVGPEKSSEEFEAARLRRREVAAKELLALAALADDEDVEKLKAGPTYQALWNRHAAP